MAPQPLDAIAIKASLPAQQLQPLAHTPGIERQHRAGEQGKHLLPPQHRHGKGEHNLQHRPLIATLMTAPQRGHQQQTGQRLATGAGDQDQQDKEGERQWMRTPARCNPRCNLPPDSNQQHHQQVEVAHIEPHHAPLIGQTK